MEQKRRGKVIFRSGSLALKIIVAVLILFSLEEKIEDLGSVKSVEDIARSELGLADPNTLILDLQPQS